MESPIEKLIPEMRRGVLQMAILQLLRDKSYGYALCKKLGETGFPTEEGTLYPILRRFEDQALIHSSWNTDGPRPRKYYQTTRRGTQIIEQLETEWKEIASSLERLMNAEKR